MAETTMPRDYTRPRSTTTRRRRSQAPDATARDRARLILALDGRHWLVSDDLETERELRELAERLAELRVAGVAKRDDTRRLDWLEVALRDGLDAEVHAGQYRIGYCDAAGAVDASEAEGTGPTLREAIDDALGREDAAFAALDARAAAAS